MTVERRREQRLLCADLVDVDWSTGRGVGGRAVANLEDISVCGACLQVEHPIPLSASVRIAHRGGRLTGVVRYCVLREIGYFIGVEFALDSKWSEREFQPRHLLDPRKVPAKRAY